MLKVIFRRHTHAGGPCPIALLCAAGECAAHVTGTRGSGSTRKVMWMIRGGAGEGGERGLCVGSRCHGRETASMAAAVAHGPLRPPSPRRLPRRRSGWHADRILAAAGSGRSGAGGAPGLQLERTRHGEPGLRQRPCWDDDAAATSATRPRPRRGLAETLVSRAPAPACPGRATMEINQAWRVLSRTRCRYQSQLPSAGHRALTSLPLPGL